MPDSHRNPGSRRRNGTFSPAAAALFATALLAALALSGCTGNGPAPMPPRTPVVLVSKPIAKEITDYEDFTGRTEAFASVEVRARATGYLDKILFKDGALVNKGDVLFEIDPRIYQAEVKKAESAVTQAEATRKRMQQDFARAEALLAKRSISQGDFDKAASEWYEAEAAVGVAHAMRDLAKLNLSFTKVTAPISGLVSRRYVDPGNLVKADDTLLTSIVTLDPMYASFDVDERTVLRLKRLIYEGKIRAIDKEVPFLMGLADEDGFSHQGTINFVDNKIDPGTGTLRVRGTFANPRLMYSPGLFMRIRLLVGEPRMALLVPERALGTDQDKKYLYVVDPKGEAIYRPVKVGPLHDGLRAIEKGLLRDDVVIVSGMQKVRPNSKVETRFVDPLELINGNGAEVSKKR
ncbi:MAG: efflux RND transporter periplasmic adaptor subunit [Planctomycetes bacterium]|nr:efflux RND transporter periplasmic adaptor subunit [Planctomycetota bacterium]